MDLLKEMKYVKLNKETQSIMFTSIKNSFRKFLNKKYDKSTFREIFNSYRNGDRLVKGWCYRHENRMYAYNLLDRRGNFCFPFWIALIVITILSIPISQNRGVSYLATLGTLSLYTILPTFLLWMYFLFPINPTIIEYFKSKKRIKNIEFSNLENDPVEQMDFIKKDYHIGLVEVCDELLVLKLRLEEQITKNDLNAARITLNKDHFPNHLNIITQLKETNTELKTRKKQIYITFKELKNICSQISNNEGFMKNFVDDVDHLQEMRKLKLSIESSIKESIELTTEVKFFDTIIKTHLKVMIENQIPKLISDRILEEQEYLKISV